MTAKQSTRQVTLRPQKARAATRTTVTTPDKVFALIAGMRPASGPRLYAHTVAALEVLYVTRTHAAPSGRLQALIGPRAMDYHTHTTQNLEVAGASVKLSRTGAEFFAARVKEGKAPRSLVDAFKSVFLTGAPNDDAQVKAHHISATTI